MSKKSVSGGILNAILNALFSVAGWVIVWALKLLGKLAYKVGGWAVRQLIGHPRTTLGAGLLGGAMILVGWQVVALVIGAVLLTGSVWKAAHKASFEATVEKWLISWYRKWSCYRRRWNDVMERCGLVVQAGDETHVPQVKKVRASQYWDRVELKMQVGQEVKDFASASEKLRPAFRALRVAVTELPERSDRLRIDFMRRDPFRYETVPAAPMPKTTSEIDFSALPIGLTEHLDPLLVSLVGGMLAGGGMTGAGKAGIIWNILRCLAPAIADGTVKPIFVDPKAKELRQGIELVEAGVFGTKAPETLRATAEEKAGWEQPTGDYAVTAWDTLKLFERIVEELEAANLAGGEAGERDFVPSKKTPLRPIFIDELAPLLAYWPRNLRDKLESLLGIVLTQGRAAGYIVVGLIQEPTKDIFTIRDLFARRIGLRLATEDHTDAMLTDKASDRGAQCHEIPESLPGVCFSFSEEQKTAVRGRLGYVRNEDIAELVEYVKALRSVTYIGTETAEANHAATTEEAAAA